MNHISVDEWDERLRRVLFAETLPRVSPTQDTITIRQLRVKGTYTDTVIEVIFTDERRPECTFGFAYEAGLWLSGSFEEAADDPEWVNSMLWSNFVEVGDWSRLFEVACADPDEIAWL